MTIRYRKMFPKDLRSSTVIRDLGKYVRLGVITSVDSDKGTCTVRWLDRPGVRSDVIITQGSHHEWHMPEVNAIVLVQFDVQEQARIIRYLPLGYESRVTKTFTLPKVKSGEKLWEAGGSFIYMQKSGNIVISTASEGYWVLENTTGTLWSETINWKVITEGGIQYCGLVKRFVTNADGSKSLQTISYPLNPLNDLVEYNFKMYEFGDNIVGVSQSEIPVLSITFGTVVDADGKMIDTKDGIILPLTNTNKQLMARIKLKSGVQIDIDKEGRCSISNLKININSGSADSSDPDVALGLQTNISSKGTAGQHVARMHDKVYVPLSSTYTNDQITELNSIASKNMGTLQSIVASIHDSTGAPCTLIAASLPSSPLEGVIVQGAPSVIIGDH